MAQRQARVPTAVLQWVVHDDVPLPRSLSRWSLPRPLSRWSLPLSLSRWSLPRSLTRLSLPWSSSPELRLPRSAPKGSRSEADPRTEPRVWLLLLCRALRSFEARGLRSSSPRALSDAWRAPDWSRSRLRGPSQCSSEDNLDGGGLRGLLRSARAASAATAGSTACCCGGRGTDGCGADRPAIKLGAQGVV